MKLNRVWWHVAAIGLGVVAAVGTTGCPDNNQTNPGRGGAGGSGEVGGMGGDGGTVVPPPVCTGDWLGTACADDSPCQEKGCQGVCVKSSDTDPVFQGGPTNGYCSLKCDTSSDCPGIANICFKPMGAAEGRCVLGCELGPELQYINDPLDEFKCHGREDVACYRITAGDVCLPTCGSDKDCPNGRYCNIAAGVCLDSANPPMGKKLGMTCDPKAMPDECGNGFCIGDGTGKGFCSGVCTIGGDIFGAPDCGGLDNGLCMYLPAIDGCPDGQACVGAGDMGFCGGGCKTHDDCGAADSGDWWCSNLNAMFPNGYCTSAKACPMGTECGANDGKCTDTKVGKYCLDPYPLGQRDVTGGGGAGGGAGTGGAGGAGGGP